MRCALTCTTRRFGLEGRGEKTKEGRVHAHTVTRVHGAMVGRTNTKPRLAPPPPHNFSTIANFQTLPYATNHHYHHHHHCFPPSSSALLLFLFSPISEQNGRRSLVLGPEIHHRIQNKRSPPLFTSLKVSIGPPCDCFNHTTQIHTTRHYLARHKQPSPSPSARPLATQRKPHCRSLRGDITKNQPFTTLTIITVLPFTTFALSSNPPSTRFPNV